MSKLLVFLATFRADDLPPATRHHARRALLDTLGVGFGGAATPLSGIIRDHAAEINPGLQPLAFDGRGVNAAGQALALGMTIDALDGHDGYNPAKGHIGAGLIAGLLALGAHHRSSAADFETALIAGYEAGSRLALALHGTASDYHTSGAWVAVAIAAAGGRMIGLDAAQTAHAMGIAEYYGPRSQMMRCIDHPTMLKDGSGWGAMAGVSAVLLAARGFTGAPALTADAPAEVWADLGQRWLIGEQYFKPYPVCRWAQGPVEAVLALRAAHNIAPEDVETIEIISFHEATRLAITDPKTTEEAQYSTAYPAAVAMVRGAVGARDLDQAALDDPAVRRIASRLSMVEADHANANFPQQRPARARITLTGGKVVESDWHEPRWSATSPPGDAELIAKFHGLADPALGPEAALALRQTIMTMAFPEPGKLLGDIGHPARTRC